MCNGLLVLMTPKGKKRGCANPFGWRTLFSYGGSGLLETVARRRSAALLSEFGLCHVREYAPFGLILSALHLILRAKSQHI